MENEQKSGIENTGKNTITRRRLLQCTAIGGLVTLTGIHIAYRRHKVRNTEPVVFRLEGTFNKPGSFPPSDFGYHLDQATRSLMLSRVVVYSKDGVPKGSNSGRNSGVFMSQQNRICLEFVLLLPQESKHIFAESRVYSRDGQMLAEGRVIHQSDEKTYSPRLLGSTMRTAEPIMRLDIYIPNGVSLEDCKTLEVEIQEFVFPRSV